MLRRPAADSPFGVHGELDRLFDEIFGDWGIVPRRQGGEDAFATFSPRVNVSETDKEITVSAEVPGLDEKDVTVELDDTALTLSGEKKEESEEKGRDWRRVEQAHGSFHRVLPLPTAIDAEKAKATFKKGVLTVTLPKKEEDKPSRKTIDITTD